MLLQECAEQFEGKDTEASAECVRLILAREKELGISGSGDDGCAPYKMDVTSVSINGGESAHHEDTLCDA